MSHHLVTLLQGTSGARALSPRTLAFLTRSLVVAGVGLAACGISSGASAASADDLQAQINALQKQVDALKAAPAPASTSSSSLPSIVAPDGTLTWYGVTLYGTVDIGVSNQSHGQAYNPDVSQGVSEPWSKSGNRQVTNVTQGGLSQSKIGLKGQEELYDGWSAVFQVESAISPVSGTLANGPKSLVDNNGVSAQNQSYSADSSRAGQVFSGPANAGIKNATLGSLTFGRHTTPLFDAIISSDPAGGSYAFSLFTGTWFGGATEDARLDDSVKYQVQYGPARLNALYQFAGNSGGILAGHDSAYYVDLGWTQSIFTVDAVYGVKKDAIFLSTLSGAAVANNPGTLAATLANLYDAAVMGTVNLKPVKLFAGYQHVTFTNPDYHSTSSTGVLPVLGGYNVDVANITTTSYSNGSTSANKSVHTPWLGAKWSVDPKFDITASTYLILQDNYSGFNNATCLNRGLTKCQGSEEIYSLYGDYRFTKRFDLYGGFEYSRVEEGLYQNVGAFHNNNLSPFVGGRFSF